MVFEPVNELKDIDFYKLLEKKAKKLKIINISDIKKGDDGNNYIYIDFLMSETSQEIGIPFNIVLSDGKILITSKTKLYPLISFATGLESNKIKGFYDDLKDTLLNLEFKAISKRCRGENATYYEIIPLEKVVN